MATMSMLGALFGFSLFGFLLQTVHAYAIYCLVIICTVGLTCVVAREKARDEAPPWSAAELISAYSIDIVTYPDFFWVFVTRVFYYMGISLQVCRLPRGLRSSALARRPSLVGPRPVAAHACCLHHDLLQTSRSLFLRCCHVAMSLCRLPNCRLPRPLPRRLPLPSPRRCRPLCSS